MKRFRVISCVCLGLGLVQFAQAGEKIVETDPGQLSRAFDAAAAEFKIPASLLKAVAFAETRWEQVIPDQAEPSQDDEQEHVPVYGVMGLRSDPWFGHSLERSAALIGRPAQDLMDSPEQNIRGAAALIKSLGGASSTADDPMTWVSAVKGYCGIPDDQDANLYAQEVFKVMQAGVRQGGIEIPALPITLPGFLEDVGKSSAADASDEPDLGLDWDPSRNFDAGQIRQMHVIIHATEGSFAGAVSWLKSPQSRASAHFIFRSRDGYGKQLVRERDRAWHARCWNPYSLGIEHEGYVASNKYYTEVMYQKSAALVRRLASKYGIPVDDMHIVGHDFWMTDRFKNSDLARVGNCNDHDDPGKFWNWQHFFDLIRNGL